MSCNAEFKLDGIVKYRRHYQEGQSLLWSGQASVLARGVAVGVQYFVLGNS